MTFPTTRWTMIRRAAGQTSGESRMALETLCEHYRAPVLAWMRRRVDPPDRADDLVQEFFTQLLEGKFLQRADAEVGRFRSFLVKAARDFMIDTMRADLAQKRGGTVSHVRIDAENSAEPSIEADPGREFDRLWAREILLRSVRRLESEYRESDRSPLFNALKGSLDGSSSDKSQELCAALGMSEGALRVARHRMRKRLGQIIRDEVSDTVSKRTDIDEEIRDLLQLLEPSR